MVASSCEQPSDYSASSGGESTSSFVFSVPSDSSDVQTDITPLSSPAPIDCEGKSMTPRDILKASHSLTQFSQSVSQAEISPTKSTLRQRNHRRSYLRASAIFNDEAGYEADGDEVASTSTGGSAIAKTTHRPKFPRIDTMLRRRVASLLAGRPSSGDTNEIFSPTSQASVAQTFTSLKNTFVRENHELQQRMGEPVGLGFGLPGDHLSRSRAFTMPSISPTSEEGPGPSEWLPSLMSSPALALENLHIQPTRSEISPSPIDCLPSSMVCYGKPVELTPSHLAALTYTPEYSVSYDQTGGGMDDVSVASWAGVGFGGNQPLGEVVTPKNAFSSSSLTYV